MANEIRSRTLGVSGVLTATLASATTTMTSDALADLPVIDATNFAPITLFRADGNGRITQKEIVWVTAHTAAAATATILRAQEGTSPQNWDAGDSWVHGPTPADFQNVWRVVSKTAAYTAVDGDVVLVDATGGVVTITLPAAASARRVRVKKTDSTTNSVTVSPSTGTIDGASSLPISAQYTAYELMSDGTNWWVA